MTEGYTQLSLPSSKASPVVSVICLTYKHGDFIHQSLEGFLMQETTFEYEILIFDDYSPDNTQEVVAQYLYHHPKGHLIKYFRQNQNIGVSLNGLFALKNSQGKYIALCEGDDYWIEPYKLQRQVDFLEKNSEYMVAYHRVDVLGEENVSLTLGNQAIHESYSFGFADSLQGKHGATLSMLFNADVIKQISIDFNSKLAVGDWPLECSCTLLGKGYFLNESMGVYRMHNQGINNTLKKSDFFNSRAGLVEQLLKLPASQKYRPLLKKFLFRVYILKFSYYLQTRHKTTAVKALLASTPYFYMNCLKDDVNWKSSFQIKQPLQKLLTKLRKRFNT